MFQVQSFGFNVKMCPKFGFSDQNYSIKKKHCPNDNNICVLSGGNIAWYNPLPACDPGHLTLNFEPRSVDGLLLYSGPRNDVHDAPDVGSDYLALELRRGRPVFYLNLGNHTTKLEFGQSMNDNSISMYCFLSAGFLVNQQFLLENDLKNRH